MDAEPHPVRHALMVVRLADAVEQALLGDLDRELLAMVARDQMQHQVERRGAARAGQPVAVDLEQIGADVDLRELAP